MSHLPSIPDGSLIDVFRCWPETTRTLLACLEQIMRTPCGLTAGRRELLAAYISRLNGCEYSERCHMQTAAQFGIEDSIIDELENGKGFGAVRPAMRPVFRLAKKITRSPSYVTQSDIDAVLDAGWDETTLFYVVQACGAINMMNRIVQTLGIETQEQPTKAVSRTLYHQGYEGLGRRRCIR